jgi:hypothetical protein
MVSNAFFYIFNARLSYFGRIVHRRPDSLITRKSLQIFLGIKDQLKGTRRRINYVTLMNDRSLTFSITHSSFFKEHPVIIPKNLKCY